MRAEGILRQVLVELEPEVHRARLGAVSAAVVALLTGGAIALSSLGRAIARHSKIKHGIKRIDRLLGNGALQTEVGLFYGAVTRRVVGRVKRPVILVDWTEVGRKLCALTAAVPTAGRAVTIYTVTCPKTKMSNPRIERRFLETLKSLLPAHCTPIIVTDAGFRAPWIRRVRRLGWDFVGRIRGGVMVRQASDESWQRSKHLFALARRAPRDLASWYVVRRGHYEARLITVDKRSRRARAATRSKPRKISERRCAAANREPWLLATSLSSVPPRDVVAIYSKRMQIEETFRDLKSHRFGWGFNDAGSRDPSRVAIQILLMALASLVALLVGLAAVAAGAHKAFQANTTTKRRVLSLVTLGRLVLTEARSAICLPSRPARPLFALHQFVGIP